MSYVVKDYCAEPPATYLCLASVRSTGQAWTTNRRYALRMTRKQALQQIGVARTKISLQVLRLVRLTPRVPQPAAAAADLARIVQLSGELAHLRRRLELDQEAKARLIAAVVAPLQALLQEAGVSSADHVDIKVSSRGLGRTQRADQLKVIARFLLDTPLSMKEAVAARYDAVAPETNRTVPAGRPLRPMED